MHKVLFLTFFWPPSGKASLHWPLKIIKHLPSYDWQPDVLTVTEDTFSAKDESMLKEVDRNLQVTRTGYFDPFVLYRRFTGKSADEPLIASETISKTNKSISHRISIWIRMNLFVPDARIGWYRQAVKAGKDIISRIRPHAIVTIGPPHSTHLIGRKLSRLSGVPFIPVLIDPWIDIAYYRDFRRSFMTLKLDNYLERIVMKDASQVVFVTKSTQEDFRNKYPWISNKSHVLYWGYNEDSFHDVKLLDHGNQEVLLHAGNIFDFQNPRAFWKTVKKEIDSGRNLKIKFAGTVSPGIKKSIEEAGLSERTEYLGFLPYDKVVQQMCSASYLLVCPTEKRHVPGKLFEYLRTGKPIIAFGNDNEEVESILNETNAGFLYPYEEGAEDFFVRAREIKTDMEKVLRFDRREIAGQMSEVLNRAKQNAPQ